ncbi:MAG: TonB-dependent receptor [Moraxella sp.]|nr:TonB-dependent receptor [Moraxella sp.]
MNPSHKRLPLATAIFGVLALQVAHANETQPHVNLEALEAQVDRQGTKVKTNVVTLQEKDESTATGLRELLQSEPAIDFGGGNGASQYISIRGMGQNSIDVKIDNAYSDTQTLYHQSRHQLDPSLVKIVAVQKGAGSASAGIGATNGAIVAKTVDAYDLLKENQDIGFKVGAGYSSNDEHSYNASVYGRAGNFDFLLAGNRIKQDDYKAGSGYTNYLGGDTVPSSDLDKVSYLAKIGANVGDHRFVLSHLNSTDKGVRNVREEFDIFNPPTAGGRLRLSRQNPQYRELSLTQTNLEWTGKNLGFINEVTANAYVMKNKRESATDVGSYGAFDGYNETSIDTKGANINFDSQVHDDVLIKYGINYRHQEVNPNQERDGFVHQKKADTGLYTEIIGTIGNLTATAGVRYDHFKFTAMDNKEVSNSDLNPSFGLIYQATPTLSFNANHNYATRSPRLVDALVSGARTVSIADNVKAEKAQNTEVGFNYNDGRFALDGSYYWQDIDDLLTNGQVARHDDTGAVTYYTGISNVGYAKNRGWELNGRYMYQGLTARLGVADSDPEFYSTPDAQGNLPGFGNREYAVNLGRTWTAGLSYRFDQPNVEVGVNHRRTDKAKGAVWKNDPSYDANAVRDGYNTTDIYANWKPYGNDRMNINFAVNNISDEYYVPQTMAGVGLPAVGREYRVGVNFTY